ncbi:amidase [Planctomonas psychrotolerans]|uniref:amidase n=1 Tax=Planctomonas psychrotolerans TaxID=2528712 RepID=UPI00123A53BC|nr:amidase family protein [Planctomonas psychrotolerans]
MEPHEYAGCDATELRDLIRSGAVRADEVEDAARRAIDAVNPDLNALTGPLLDTALDAASDGVLAGVPFLIKDSGPFARGVPFTLGSRSIRGAVADADAPMMSRFRAAGLRTLGVTTAPEYGLSFSTESTRYGPTRNPWALDRGVGGSSGGAAALVAAGAVPLAHANDAAGSIRVPASCCGLVGLKPSRGRTPTDPGGDALFGLLSEFALTRTVRDAALLLDAVAPAPSASPFVRAVGSDPGRLRIAMTTEAASGVPVDGQVRATTVAVGELLQWIGHAVESATPPFDAESIVEAEMLGVYGTGAAILRASRPDPRLLESVSRIVLAECAAAGPAEITAAQHAQQRVTNGVAAFFSDYDLLVTPTLARLPVPHGTLDYDAPTGSARSWLRTILEYGPFTAPFNVSGNPAISLPVGQSREGLPIGVQLVAARGREYLLLQVAAALEQALPWRDRQPPIFAD